MLKFMVVLFRRADLSADQFRRHLEDVHAPLAKALPRLKKYRQNYAVASPNRRHPGWDAIVELYFDSRDAMEAAWASPQGEASDADLQRFADLSRTTWSVVEEITWME